MNQSDFFYRLTATCVVLLITFAIFSYLFDSKILDILGGLFGLGALVFFIIGIICNIWE